MYKITRFDEIAGQIYVTFTVTGGSLVIDVPVENGMYIAGEALDSYIMGFIPAWVVDRKHLIDRGIPNADAVHSMVERLTDEERTQKLTAEARARRDEALFKCDWCLLPDSGFNQEVIDDLLIYRQKLRDVPQQPKFPYEIDWPESNTWALWEKQKNNAKNNNG